METKKRWPPKNDPLTEGDLEAFKNLGVGEGDMSLRKLIYGQRRINGRLLVANEEIKEVLEALGRRIDSVMPVGQPQRSVKIKIGQSLNEIAKHLRYVGGDEPPGCERPGGN